MAAGDPTYRDLVLSGREDFVDFEKRQLEAKETLSYEIAALAVEITSERSRALGEGTYEETVALNAARLALGLDPKYVKRKDEQ